MSKVKIDTTVRINAYSILDDAVEVAVRYGYQRAHKHTETPAEADIVEAIHSAVMTALTEVLIFSE